MKGWKEGDKITDDRGNTGVIVGLSTLGAWVKVRGRVNCIGWGGKNGMPDREEYDRRRASKQPNPSTPKDDTVDAEMPHAVGEGR